MVLLGVLEAIAPSRATGLVQVGRVAVDQLPAVNGNAARKRWAQPWTFFHRVVALQALQHPLIQIDADVAQRRRLALHDRPAAQVGLDVGVVGGIRAMIGWHKPEVALEPK